MCVEGIRVRSTPAGYDLRENAPWTFANLTGRDAPKTNIARSDLEQTPELEGVLLQIYLLLGKHIEREFERLRAERVGIVEAAWEADYITTSGLEHSRQSSNQKFSEAMSDVRVFGIEDENVCRAVTLRDLQPLEAVWSVDSRLVRSLEGVGGAAGLDMPVSRLMERLGSTIKPAIPVPRVLGNSENPLVTGRDIKMIRVYREERSHRIDICWGREEPGKWVQVPRRILDDDSEYYDQGRNILITGDPTVSSECSDYDIVYWRSWCLITAT